MPILKVEVEFKSCAKLARTLQTMKNVHKVEWRIASIKPDKPCVLHVDTDMTEETMERWAFSTPHGMDIKAVTTLDK